MAMSMMKEAWLESFGGCETLENTPATIAELEKRALAGMPTEFPRLVRIRETVRTRRVFRYDAMDGDH